MLWTLVLEKTLESPLDSKEIKLLLLLLLSRFSRVRLCDPMDCSPPGFSVHGILQAITLEWVAISFSNAGTWKVKVTLLNRVWLLSTPWTAAYQAPPSIGFSWQQYWSGLPLPSPEIKLVNCKGNQTWIFIGRTDTAAEVQYFGHLMRRANSLEKTLSWERLKAGGEGDDRGWDGWMASPTQWTWVWANSGRCEGQRSLACCSPWGHKESDRAEGQQ